MTNEPNVLRPDPGQIQVEPEPVEVPAVEETPGVEEPADEEPKP
jgi:hypothetical protein